MYLRRLFGTSFSVDKMARATAIPPNSYFHDGYHIFRLSEPKKVTGPAGGFFLVEHEIRLKRAPATARREGYDFMEALQLKPQLNEETGRWDLRVDLAKGGGRGQKHTFFHRLLGLCLRKANYDAQGRNRPAPGRVRPTSWKHYEVDHCTWIKRVCRLRNLRPTSRHRGEGRDGWNRKSLTHAEKVKRVRKLWKKVVARRVN